MSDSCESSAAVVTNALRVNFPTSPLIKKSLIRVFVVHMKKKKKKKKKNTLHPWLSRMHPVMILIRLRTCAGADLNPRWPHMSEGTFSDVAAQIFGVVLFTRT